MAYPFEPAMLSSPGAGPEGWRHDGFSQVAAGVRAPVPGRGGLRRVAAGAPLGIGLRLPGVRPRPLLAARAQGPDPAMPGLSARDLGDGGHGHAPQPPAAEGLVHRRLAGGDAQERDVGPPAVAAARAGQLQVGLAAVAQAAGGDGRPEPGTAGRPGRGGRDQPALPQRGRAGPTRPVARGQAADRGGGRDRGQGPGADPAGGDRGLRGREPGRLRRRQRRGRQHGGERRLVRLRQAQGRQARPAGGRRRPGPPDPALGAPGVREREALGLGRLPRPARGAPPGLPGRVRVPVQPPPHASGGVRPPPRPRGHDRTTSLRRPRRDGLKGISHPADNHRRDSLCPAHGEGREDVENLRHESAPPDRAPAAVPGRDLFSRYAPVPLPASLPPLLAVVVDTEEEFEWSALFSRGATSVTAMRGQQRAQRLLERYRVVPTYAITYPVATQPDGYRPLQEFLADGACAIGAHPPPWVTPPFDEPVTDRTSIAGNLAAPLERAKLARLTDAIADRFGRRPVVHKAGRYGIGPSTEGTLEGLGYLIDA